MIIKSKPLPVILIKFALFFLALFLRPRFNKMVIKGVDIKPRHSYLLMCNHFSFLDGFFSLYLCFKAIDKRQPVKRVYIMSVKKQMQKKPWLKYFGSFSVDPGKRSVNESLEFAAEKLSEPGNILFYYPQGNLESSHIRHIVFQDGVYEIITRIKGNCQLLWSSNITEYFESTKPSVYFDMLDCGTNHQFDFEALKLKVNQHHLRSLKSHVRFTKEC
ncbi:hypothetical protein BH09BAC6_BH09BAC6_31890 [soil metagenome]|jgi:hypothetical protein